MRTTEEITATTTATATNSEQDPQGYPSLSEGSNNTQTMSTYASTHQHPNHIDIPDRASEDIDSDSDLPDDNPFPTTTPSGTKPPPAKGILKNPIKPRDSEDDVIPNDVGEVAINEREPGEQ